MKTKSSDNEQSYQFFQTSTITDLENSIRSIIAALDGGQLKPHDAEMALNFAGKDLHKLFWHLTSEISLGKNFARNYAGYTLTTGHIPNEAKQMVNEAHNAIRDEISSILHQINSLVRGVRKSTKKPILRLDLAQPLDYNYGNDDMAVDYHSFRVQPVDHELMEFKTKLNMAEAAYFNDQKS